MKRKLGLRARRSRSRGMTLMDSVLALFVFVIGVAAVFGMLSRVSTANRRTAYITNSLDAFAQIAAEIRDAKCFFPAETPGDINLATMDPGLNQRGANWVSVPVNGSIVERVGDFTDTVPNLNVSYRVTAPVVAPNEAPVLDIEVRVREIMHNAAQDDPQLATGYWIQVYPVKKMCNPRADATARGEY